MSIKFQNDKIAKHVDLASRIKTNLVVEGDTIKEAEGHSSYYGNLPEGITKKEVQEIAKYNGKFVTATHVAVGELAADIFKKSKDTNEVNASIGYFADRDSVDINVSRAKTYKIPNSDNNEEVTKHLVMKTTVTTQSAKGTGLKSVRDSMSEEFKDIFKK